MNETSDLLVEQRADVLHLTLNRPEKRNALSLALLDEIGATLEDFRDKPIKCAVITGAGDRCFAAGGDLNELNAIRSPEQTRAMSERGHAALDAIRYFPAPVIGALNGLALGGGAELAMACDIRIAAAHADLGLIQSKLNLTTAWGGGIDLINAIGNSAALEVLCSGRRLTATEALDMRIYSTVAGDDSNFASFVADYLTSFTQPGLTVFRSYKATAARRRHALQAELLETARDGFIESWNHEDHWDAARRALPKKS